MGEMQAAVGSGPGPGPVLEASVSFGRFETDSSLSWEKWSTFSPNKYMEEVEKCATAGSVAQKKAYFEAHYKKIFAPRKQVENSDSGTPESPGSGNQLNDKDGGTRNSDEQEIPNAEDFGEICKNPDGIGEGIEEDKMDYFPEWSKSAGSSSIVEVQEVPTKTPEEGPENESKTGKCISGNNPDENPRLNLQRKPQKTDPVKYEDKKAGRLQKKAGPPVKKSPGTSASKTVKPTSPLMSSTRSGVAIPLERTKNPPQREKQRTIFPKSLHMSISLGSSAKKSSPTNHRPSIIDTRKSLIAESLGGKDSGKRVAKSFQNAVGRPNSFIEERSPLHKPAPSLAAELRASISVANRTDGRRPNSIQTTPRSMGTPSFRSGIIEKEEKQKEAEEIRKPRKNLQFKARPLPSFYRAPSKSKIVTRKDGLKSEIHE